MKSYIFFLTYLVSFQILINAQTSPAKSCTSYNLGKYFLNCKITGKLILESCDCSMCDKQNIGYDTFHPNRTNVISLMSICLPDKTKAFGTWIDKLTNKEYCLIFPAYLLETKNTFILTFDPTNITFFGTSIDSIEIKNILLVGLQFGYYFRSNILSPSKKFKSIQPSYSLNIKQGITIRYDQRLGTEKSLSPFMGADVAINYYFVRFRTFISYSTGYAIIQPGNASHWYSSLGFNWILF